MQICAYSGERVKAELAGSANSINTAATEPWNLSPACALPKQYRRKRAGGIPHSSKQGGVRKNKVPDQNDSRESCHR